MSLFRPFGTSRAIAPMASGAPIAPISIGARCASLVLAACATVSVAPDASVGTAPLDRPQVRTTRATALKRLSLDDLYDPEKKIDFGGKPATNQVWLDDAHWLWPSTDAKTKKKSWLRVDAATGASEPFTDATRVEKAIAAIPGVSAEQAQRLAHPDTDALSEDRSALVLDVLDDVFVYRFGDEQVIRLTATPVEEELAAFSPDARRVAYVRENDLYVSEVDPPREIRVTEDGSTQILNGKLDWLYQEEVYGRGDFDAKWWSPDSAALAYLRLDEKDVPAYTLVDDVASPAIVETSPYPRAGDPNPTVRLGVWRTDTGTTTWVDLAVYAGSEFLIVDVAWSPKGTLFFQVQDREQTWLDLVCVDPQSGATRRLFRETTPAWVEPLGSPKWLADESFLWFSERTGWKHLYHYRPDGSLIRVLTSGEWEARALHGIDEKAGLVYFSGTERSHIGLDVYRIPLAGGAPQRLSQRTGTHSANFSPGFAHFIDAWSDLETPTQVRLYAADGREVRVIDENRVAALAEYALSKPERIQVETRDGFPMEALMIKPLDFDPARRYPVFQPTYAGPHAPQVRDAWAAGGMFLQLLAQRGILVWICDNRSASGKGAVSAWTAYKRLGEGELADIEDGLAWLKRQPYVDGSRIAISGWSYGGFMAAYALTHSTSFAAGIAGGSVTDWANYDTIYTERLMLMPKNNREGYERTSVVAAAKHLAVPLLLIHGQLDDNVHPQNTLQLVHALQKAGKPFELMLYPKSAHGVVDPALVKHMRTTMLRFLEENLLAEL